MASPLRVAHTDGIIKIVQDPKGFSTMDAVASRQMDRIYSSASATRVTER